MAGPLQERATDERRAGLLAPLLAFALSALALLAAWVPGRPAQARQEAAEGPSATCIECHQGIESMHATIEIDCVDCHGGDGTQKDKQRAHVQPRNKHIWQTSANPANPYAWLNEESSEFVRFINPSDLRVAHLSCGPCHGEQVRSVRKSIMAHNAMVHNAVFYNNGSIDTKIPQYGEAFDVEGNASMLVANPPPSREAVEQGALARLAPHPAFQITRIQDPLRIAEVNNPALGTRGPGTDGRIAGVFLNVLKTRLNDPTLWMMGPNKIAGDYRASGCAACHVPYANSRDETSGPWAEFGNRGYSFSGDKAIPKNESGHPIRHQFTRSIPVMQCLTCHYHQGDGAIGTYAGLIWWDRETEAEKIKALGAEPEYGPGQGELWPRNSEFDQVQFFDNQAHGWNFMKVFKRDLKGNLLDADDNVIAENDPDKWKKAVHLKDIHFEKGLHCIDCHTKQDVHGDGNIYAQMRDYIEIRCIDCHGTISQRATLKTSGGTGGNSLGEVLTPFGMPQFEWVDDKLIQRSKVDPDRQWEVRQLADAVNPESPLYNERAAYAKLLRRDGSIGTPAEAAKDSAHRHDQMECFACHSSWTTTCSGCHLPLDLNVKSPDLHYAPQYSRGYAPYYRQVVRTDTFFLGIGPTNQGNKITPFRPASAVVVTAYDRNRNNIIHQQPLISAPGFANEAMTPFPPHTVRTKETKQCTDCHLSQANDNNARIATLLGFGVNAFTFFGQYSFLADRGHGVTGIQVTEGREPQPVIGSNFHRILHPQSYDKFVGGGRRLPIAYSRRATGVQALTYRGEYLLSAEGSGGFKLYDIANINNKAVAQRIVQAVNSPFGERTEVPSPDATFAYFPSSLPVHYGRKMPEENQEQPLHAIFRFALGTDRQDGLVLIDVNTLTDNDPENNRLRRDVVFNPQGKLRGAVMVKTYGRYAYVVSEETGLSVVDINTPYTPRLVYQSAPGELDRPNAVELQLRYAFVLDRAGMKVLDITSPEKPTLVPETVAIADARGFSLFRTYAVIAAGAQGLAIIDITNPEKPGAPAFYNAEGALNDAWDVAVGATNVSFFAYVADGKNGLRIVRLAEPPETPGHMGYSPPLAPKLIASYSARGEAVMVARGQIRDRYVDEAGNQVAVSNRIGARPFNAAEMRRFLYYPDGRLLRITNEVPPQLRRSGTARR